MSKNLDSIHISSYIYSISYHRSLFRFFNGFFLQEIGCDSIWEILFNVQSIYGAATILFLFVIYILSFSLFSICSGAYTHLFQRKDKLYSNFHPKSGLRMSLFWNNWVSFDVSMAMNVSSVGNDTIAKNPVKVLNILLMPKGVSSSTVTTQPSEFHAIWLCFAPVAMKYISIAIVNHITFKGPAFV